MKTVIDEYALEQKTEKGAPSGKFKMNKKQCLALGKEVITRQRHLQEKPKEAE